MKELAQDRLAELLWHGARTRDVRGAWQHRAAASAGGIHPLHLLIFSRGSREALLYDPLRHCAHELDTVAQALVDAVDQSMILDDAGDATLLLLAAEVNRAAAAYEDPLSLVWRDAGCLIATLQLVASWLSLVSCPLGILGEPLLEACGAQGHLIAAGVLAVGERAAGCDGDAM
jgi:hypothetical protein